MEVPAHDWRTDGFEQANTIQPVMGTTDIRVRLRLTRGRMYLRKEDGSKDGVDYGGPNLTAETHDDKEYEGEDKIGDGGKDRYGLVDGELEGYDDDCAGKRSGRGQSRYYRVTWTKRQRTQWQRMGWKVRMVSHGVRYWSSAIRGMLSSGDFSK